jgi:hypothetical protein
MTDQAIVRGVAGQLRWAYYVAAGVEGWAAVRDKKAVAGGPLPRWTLTARVIGADAYKIAQRPLLFVVTHARGRWVWPIETMRISEGRLTARCGPVEEYRV